MSSAASAGRQALAGVRPPVCGLEIFVAQGPFVGGAGADCVCHDRFNAIYRKFRDPPTQASTGSQCDLCECWRTNTSISR